MKGEAKSSIDIDATSAISEPGCRWKSRGSFDASTLWNAWPDSWSSVRRSPSTPTAFMKINGCFPRPELLQPHPTPSLFVDSLDRRQHSLFDRHVKPQAVLGCVIETVLLAMRKVAEIGEAGVPGDFLPQVVHAVEEAGQHVALVDVRLCTQLECPLAHVALRGLQERNELGRGLLLARPFDGHGRVDLGPLRAQLGELCEDGHVGLVEELHLVAEPLDHRLQAGADVSELDELFLQAHPLLLRRRRDLRSKTQLRRLLLRVRRVA